MNAVERERRGKVRRKKTDERAGLYMSSTVSVIGIRDAGQGLNPVFT